jgi:hypothetical protein
MNTRHVVWIALVSGLLLQMLVCWKSDPVSSYRKLYSKDWPLLGWQVSLTFVAPFAIIYLIAYFVVKHMNSGYEVVYT